MFQELKIGTKSDHYIAVAECDEPTCRNAQITHDRTSQESATNQLKAAGWRLIGRQCYCPVHSPG